MSSPSQDLAFSSEDLDFILKQIEIAEDHVLLSPKGDCSVLLEILPNASVPWGLRTVDGSCNNLVPGQENFGAADIAFTSLVPREYREAEELHTHAGEIISTTYGSSESVADSTPRLISHLIVNQSTDNPAAVSVAAAEDGINIGPDIAAADQYFIPNTAPDEGLSAPFNALLTFFGQFFDHGLDLINKGGNGMVLIPLQEDDPLYDASCIPGFGPPCNMMFMTRATIVEETSVIEDENGDQINVIEKTFINTTTPHVDQQQTYASHTSSHVVLREYEVSQSGMLESTGYLLTGPDGGMSNWFDLRTQARDLMGIELDDLDGNNMPKIVADIYGKFIPGPDSGLPQLVIMNADDTTTHVEGNVDFPVDATQAMRTGHSFFIDVAHSAAPNGMPDADTVINERVDMLTGQETRGIRESEFGQYDNELLDEHFMCGDGRCNENIALTAIHHVFHSEHNRLVDVAKRVILDSSDTETLNEWLDTDASQTDLNNWSSISEGLGVVTDASRANQDATSAALDDLGLDWNGERLFQVARFGTEMQYNRVVFDEFSPTLSGLKDDFEGYHTNVDPSITTEFSQSVYRFGHSMLTDTVDRYDVNFNTITDAGALNQETASDQLGLFEAFLNPLALYNSDGDGNPTLDPWVGTGAIFRGITRTTGNEIDEFVTGSLQNNLVGLALDLGAINIARGRDVGNPSLNEARKLFYEESGSTQLKPYNSWMDYGDNLRHEESLVNFIAAYGTHSSITEKDTYDDKRGAACAIVGEQTGDAETYCIANGWWSGGSYPTPADALDFLYSRGDYANNADGTTITGVDDIDMWVGGLAEERMPFGGYLGSTHNYVFENQIEDLQNGDRFYYVGRTANTNFFSELESNSFTSLVMRNTDLGEAGAGTMSLNIFSRSNLYMEVDQNEQFNQEIGSSDPVGDSELFSFWIRDPELSTSNINVSDPARFLETTGGDHYTMNGSEGDDTIIGGIGDDSIWGRAGDDRIEGGDGADLIEGGDGDDIITDLGGPDVIEGGAGNDAIHSGNEVDVIFGDNGNDFIVNSSEFGEIFGGEGNDYILDGHFLGHTRGGEGDDWMENLGGGEDLFQADNGAAPEAGEPATKGNDIFIGWGGNNDADMENGDDIVVDGPGIDRVEGQLGFDWVSFQYDTEGVNVDLGLTIFSRPTLPPSNASVSNRYDRVEGISGSSKSDILQGTENKPGVSVGNELLASNMHLITGLSALVPATELTEDCGNDIVTGEAQGACWENGDIILGGGGSDLIVSTGGNDIIDGDAALSVGISTPNPDIRSGELGTALAAARLANNNAVAAADTALVAQTAAAGAATAAAATAAADELAAEASDVAAQAALTMVISTAATVLERNNDAAAAVDAATQADTDVADAVVAQDAATAAALAMDDAIAPLEAAATVAANSDTAAMEAAESEAQMADDAATASQTAANTAAAAAATALTAQGAVADAVADAAAAAALAALAAVNAAITAGEDAAAATVAMAAAAVADQAAADAQPSADAAMITAEAAADAADAALNAADDAEAAMGLSEAASQAAADALLALLTEPDDGPDFTTLGEAFELALAVASQALADFRAASEVNTAAQTAAGDAQDMADAAQDVADAAQEAVDMTQGVADQAAADAGAAMEIAEDSAAQLVLANAAAATAAADLQHREGLLDAADLAVMQTEDAAAEAQTTANTEQAEALAAQAAADIVMAQLNAANLAVTNAQNNIIAANQEVQDAIADTIAAQGAQAIADAAVITAEAAAEAADAVAVGAGQALDLAIEAARLASDAADTSAIASDAAGAVATQAADDLDAADAAVGVTETTLEVAEDALAAADQTIVVASMQDIMSSVFGGQINPGELEMSRVISDQDGDNMDTDSVSFSGARSEYTVSDYIVGNQMAFVQVEDTRPGPVSDGRSLVKNVERLVFEDTTEVLIEGRAGSAGGNINSLATGRPEITGTAEVGQTLTATRGTLEDPDGFDSDMIEWTWESELVPGESGFTAITRLGGVNGNGDAFEVNGQTMELTAEEAGLQVRVRATFQDNEGVFETARSEAVTAICDLEMGCVIPDALLGLVPANFLGTAADIEADTISFENASRPGLPRFDVTIPSVDLDLFANTGFDDPPSVGDEVLVGSFQLTFTSTLDDIMLNSFIPEIVVIENLTDGLPNGTTPDEVDVSFSIRGPEVDPLVNGLTSAVLRVDGQVLANFTLLGNSRENFAQDILHLTTNDGIVAAVALQVAQVIGNTEGIATAQAALDAAITAAPVPVEPGPVANFGGSAADIDVDSITVVNESRPGLERFDIIIEDVDIDLFGGVNGLDSAFSAGETLGCGPLPVVCPGDEIAVDVFMVSFTTNDANMTTTGTFSAEIVAIENLGANGLPDGTANQDAVNVLFSIRGADVVAPLVSGSTTLDLSVEGVSVMTRTLDGDSSLNSAQDVSGFDIDPGSPDPVEIVESVDAGMIMGSDELIQSLAPTYIVGEDNIKAIISDFDTDLLDAFPEDFDENSTYDVHGIVLTYTTISVGMEGEIIIFENSLDNAEAVAISNDDGSEYTVDLIYTLDGAAYSDTGNGLTLATLTGIEGDPMTAPLSEIFYDQEVLTTLTEIESAIDDLLTKAFSVVEDGMVEEAVIEEMTIASATMTEELDDDGVML